MKAETWIFVICTAFFALVTPSYWFITGDPTGTSALVMTTLLTALVSFYLGFHASRMEPRPEDRKDAEIADGAGEVGFFSPGSYWPFGMALAAAIAGLGVVFWQVWLLVAGLIAVIAAVCGFVFEYYTGTRKVHGHE